MGGAALQWEEEGAQDVPQWGAIDAALAVARGPAQSAERARGRRIRGGGVSRAPQSFISKHPQMPMLQLRPGIAIVLAMWDGRAPLLIGIRGMEDANVAKSST